MSPRRPRPERTPLPAGFWTLWTTVAIDLVGFGIVAPILPLYAERFGASGFQTGLLFASFSLAQFVMSPILGRLSDRVGRRPVIIASLFGTAAGSLITGFAGALWVLFLGRLIDGASGASVSVAQSAATDLAPPAQRARLLGLLGAAFGVGFVVGPAIGGLASLGGTRLPFFVAAAIALVNGVVALVRLPETRGRRVATSAACGRRTLRPASRMLANLAAVGFLSTVAFAAFEAMFSRFGRDRFGLTEGSVAVVFVGLGVVLVAVQGGLIGPLTDRVGSNRLLPIGLVVLALGMAALAASTTWWLLGPALGLLAFGQGVAAPSMSALVAEHAGEHRRGEALGFQQSAGALARIIGPAVAGWLFDRRVELPFSVAAAVAAVAVGVLVTSTRGRARVGVGSN